MHILTRSNEYDESNNEDEISSDIQSKYSDRRSNRLNECDENNIKIEISIEENGETPTHHYNSRLNECDETNIEDNVLLKEMVGTPTRNRCNKRTNECDESNIEDNVSNEELNENLNQHRSKKRKKTLKLDEQIDNVKRLLVKRFEKTSEYDWLGKQVVYEMNSIKNKKIQRDTAWKIQTILREASIADDAVTECQSAQLSRETHSDTQSSCGSCSSNKQQIRSSLLTVMRNSDSMDRSFSNTQNPVRPLHPVRLTPAKSDTGASYLYSPDNMQQPLDGL